MDISGLLQGFCESLLNGLMWFIDNRNLMLIIFGSLLVFLFICKIIIFIIHKKKKVNNFSYNVPYSESIILNNVDEDDESYNTFDESISENSSYCYYCEYCGTEINESDIKINKCPNCGANFDMGDD